MGAEPRVSIVIPVHGKASLTRHCLDAVLEDDPQTENEIIVVDDASPDLTLQLLDAYGDRIRVVRHEINTGFATACNDGAAIASGDYVVFLNNDTLPTGGWLDALVLYADQHPKAAVVGAKLLYPNDTIQHAGVVISYDRYPRHVYVGFPADHPAVNKSRRFQAVTAACALVRRQIFEEFGGFDAAFRNGYEDVDLCLGLAEQGYEIHYCHESVVYHLESLSRELNPVEIEHNTQLLRSRWAERVHPDELDYYLDDGLLTLSYTNVYPIHFVVSPELALVLRGGEELPQTERLLNARSRQVYELLRDNIRLNLRVREAELQAAAAPLNGDGAAPHPAGDPRIICRGDVQWLSDEPNGRLVSVVLPVKNGSRHLRELLPRILEQRTRDQVEIVAIDSGSTDGSVDVLRGFSATVVAIDPASFNHGLTRNLGAAYARGDILVFTNQSALPADDSWLGNLLAPLDDDPAVAGVCSRVLPRDEADLMAYRDGMRDPSASAERSIRSITDRTAYDALPHHQLRLLTNFHTVSAAIRRSVLASIPFRDVTIGEDVAWAKDVLEAGFKIQHEPTSVVFHGHAYPLLDLFRRNVDDGIANREIVGRTLGDDEVGPLVAQLVDRDWRYLEEECGLTGDELEHWRLEAAMRRMAQILGQWIGVNQSMGDELLQFVSLTERIKAGLRQSALVSRAD